MQHTDAGQLVCCFQQGCAARKAVRRIYWSGICRVTTAIAAAARSIAQGAQNPRATRTTWARLRRSRFRSPSALVSCFRTPSHRLDTSDSRGVSTCIMVSPWGQMGPVPLFAIVFPPPPASPPSPICPRGGYFTIFTFLKSSTIRSPLHVRVNISLPTSAFRNGPSNSFVVLRSTGLPFRILWSG
jgi:hypothetical protein